MKNIKLTLLALLLVQTAAFSQVKLSKDFKVSVGMPYKVVDAGSKDYFSDGKGYTISVKTDGEKITVQRYDINGMKELSNKMYEDFPPYNKVQKVLKMGDRLFYIFSSFNKKEKKENLYSREVNMSNGTFENPKLLFSTAAEVTVSSYGEMAKMSWGMGAPIRFEVEKSFDNSKILIRYRLRPAEKNDAKSYDILGFYVFNTAMEKQWGGEVKMPHTEKVMNNLAYGVGNDGNAYMLAYINDTKQFELLNIGSDLKAKPNKIDVDGKLIFQELHLRETADGNLNCIGYYATGIDYVMGGFGGGATLSFNTNGILSFKIDKSGKVLQKFNFEFPLDLINQYESKRAKEKNEKREDKGKAGINDLKVIDISLDTDGNTTVIGEQQYLRNEMVMTKTKKVYYYADMVATKFDKNGKLLWMKKLPKTQSAVGGDSGGSFGMMGAGMSSSSMMEKRGMSVKFIKGKGASYILFLDNVKNANLGLDDVPERHKDGMGGFLTAYKLDDATGAIEKHSIFDIRDIKGTEAFQFKTSRIFEAADKVFMLEVYIKGKEDTMIKMELTK